MGVVEGKDRVVEIRHNGRPIGGGPIGALEARKIGHIASERDVGSDGALGLQYFSDRRVVRSPVEVACDSERMRGQK